MPNCRLVLRRLLHGRLPRSLGVYRNLPVKEFRRIKDRLLKHLPHRYLNNPEAMGGAAWFGLALISGSKLVLSLAVIRHLANWWFLSRVEKCVLLF